MCNPSNEPEGFYNKASWGVFNIEGNTIKFEKWYFYGGRHYGAFISEGKILNDTTFHLTEFYRLTRKGKKKECRELDETYYFKQFSPKSDSTNVYVPYNGYLSAVKTDNLQTTIWQPLSQNAKGIYDDYMLGNSYKTILTFDEYGL